jgi:serine/threonine protein phosphatase 1
MKKKTWVIGDVHGCSKTLKLLLSEICKRGCDKLVFVGDYIDRGPDSKGVIDTIKGYQSLAKKDNCIALMGNHEDMCLHAHGSYEYTDRELASAFFMNGGGQTKKSFGGEIPQEYLDWMMERPLMHEDKDAYYIHAGAEAGVEMKDQTRDNLLWERYTFLKTPYQWDKVIFHGHTPMKEVIERPNIISIDTGCGYGFKLSAYCVQTKEIIQVNNLDIEKEG